ncbi:MAG: hypothetical protein CL544_11790 [Alcanivorax sp.]|nr:hypothetical protein [Alcanivorax sp.]
MSLLGGGLQDPHLGFQNAFAALGRFNLLAGIFCRFAGTLNLFLDGGGGTVTVFRLQLFKLGEVLPLTLHFLVQAITHLLQLFLKLTDLFLAFLVEALSQLANLSLKFLDSIFHLASSHG